MWVPKGLAWFEPSTCCTNCRCRTRSAAPWPHTNVIESASSIVETVCRNVMRRRDGDQVQRGVGSGQLAAERLASKMVIDPSTSRS